MKNVRTRIAPTPSGLLHLGNAVSFTITQALANKFNAEVLLRIDDLDTLRTKDEFVVDVFNTLKNLAIGIDLGPSNLEELKNAWSQHFRLNLYNKQLQRLVALGTLYPCACSRVELKEMGGASSQHHHCRLIKVDSFPEDVSWRIRLPENCKIEINDGFTGKINIDLSLEMPDFVVRRKDGIPSYQMASLVDDVKFDINLIVRGEDLLASTASQLYLASLLGFSQFEEALFYHHPLVFNKVGGKLSKSKGAYSLRNLQSTNQLHSELERTVQGLMHSGGAAFGALFS